MLKPLSSVVGFSILSVAVALPALAAAPAALVERYPQETLLYVGWPGADRLRETSKGTEFDKLMNEPEVARSRQQWSERIWPDLKRRILQDIQPKDEAEAARAGIELLEAAWKYPTSLGFIGVDMTPEGPQIDAALFIRAGKDAPALGDALNRLAESLAKSTQGQIADVELLGRKLKEITPGGAPIKVRVGVIDDDVVVVVGEKAWQHMATTGGPSLAKAERFAVAGKVVGASTDTPVLFLDLKGVVATLEKFQPLFASGQVPILGQPGGVTGVLKTIGMENVQSFSMAMVPEAEGFRTKWFLHAPAGAAAATQPAVTPLTDDDLKVVPRDVTSACVSRFNLAELYSGIMQAIRTLSPETNDQVLAALGMFEGMTGVKLEADIINAFGDKWVFYDAPESGGILFTGLTLIADVKPNNKLDAALQSLAAFASKQLEGKQSVTLRREEYRGQSITYLDVAGVPMPVAPAWTQREGKLIAALYPQMVRVALDQQLDKRPTLLENPGFQSARKHLPAKFTSISYGDVKGGMRLLYMFALPLGDMGIMLAQGEGVPIDPTFLPALPTVVRHLFPEVSTSVQDEQGMSGVTYGPLPVSVGGTTGGIAGAAMGAAVLLPALARAREQAKRSVSMENLKQIGMAVMMYANEHDDQFPPDLETLVKAGLIDEKVLISPLDSSGEETSYAYIAGLNPERVNPERVILAYEKPEHFNGEGTNVLFLDGHVEFMTQAAFEVTLAGARSRAEEREEPGDSEQ